MAVSVALLCCCRRGALMQLMWRLTRARRWSPSARNRLGAPFGVGSRIAAVLAEAQALQGQSEGSLAHFSVLNLVLSRRGSNACFSCSVSSFWSFCRQCRTSPRVEKVSTHYPLCRWWIRSLYLSLFFRMLILLCAWSKTVDGACFCSLGDVL